MRFPFTASERSIALLFNGRMHNIPNSHPFFEKLAEELKKPEHDHDAIRGLVDQPSVLADITEGDVTVVGSSVYYKGEALHSSLTTKVVNLIAAGFDAKPWVRFLNRVMDNPSKNSAKCLYDFLATFDAPITDDGCFVAFKRVREDYMDKYTGTFDNSPGKFVQMPREAVADNPKEACSAGLHACSIAYLDHAYVKDKTMRTVAVKIAPEDVVSVPEDYGFSKLRCCQYLVMGDIDEASTTPEEMVAKRVIADDAFHSTPDPIPMDGDEEDACLDCGELDGDCECDHCPWCGDDPCSCDYGECEGCGWDIGLCHCEDDDDDLPTCPSGAEREAAEHTDPIMDTLDEKIPAFVSQRTKDFDPRLHVWVGDGPVEKAEFRETMSLCDGVSDLAEFYDVTEATIFTVLREISK